MPPFVRLYWPFGRKRDKSAIEQQVEIVRTELSRQEAVATDRLRNPYFTDSRTGRNVARDELLALAYLRSVEFEANDADASDATRYLQRVMTKVRDAKDRFVQEENDPEGFGAGTFSEVIEKLEERLASETD